ncbi:MAG: hypothetical protein ACRELF_09240, partial [Gemmataceae bacterium]
LLLQPNLSNGQGRAARPDRQQRMQPFFLPMMGMGGGGMNGGGGMMGMGGGGMMGMGGGGMMGMGGGGMNGGGMNGGGMNGGVMSPLQWLMWMEFGAVPVKNLGGMNGFAGKGMASFNGGNGL